MKFIFNVGLAMLVGSATGTCVINSLPFIASLTPNQEMGIASLAAMFACSLYGCAIGGGNES